MTLTIATWNLENLFLPGTDAGPPDQATYDKKLASLVAMIAQIAPDVLAVQEVGDEQAFEDLLSALGGEWQARLSPDADDRGIRVGFLSTLPFDDVERIRAFPTGTDPVRLQDDGTTTTQMGRGALRVRVAGIDLITTHLKSKLLTVRRSLPAARRGRTRPLRRLRARPAHRRGDHAAPPRDRAAEGRRDRRRARRPQRRAAGGDDPDPPRPARLGVQDRRLRHARQGRRPAPVEPRADAPRGPRLQPHLQRPPAS